MSEMTPERLAELRRIAEAATPGPWISPWHLECENAEEYGFYAANGEKVVGLFWFDGYHLECSEENARHIATFDPTTALSLLDEIERLRRVLEQVEWEQSPANCPICDGYKSHGHTPDCELAAALADAPANPYTALVDAARNLAVTLHRHNEQTVLRHRLGDDADLADDEGYCCEICCEVGDLLYDLGQALGEIGIDDLSKIPDLRDLAKLDPERRAEAIRRLNEGEALEDVLVSIRGQGGARDDRV